MLILEVGPLTSLADYFLICSGESERQVKAIADHVDRELSRLCQLSPAVEGVSGATWILLDTGDIVVHVFLTAIRSYYGLEKMWRDAEQIPLSEAEALPATSQRRESQHQVAIPRYQRS